MEVPPSCFQSLALALALALAHVHAYAYIDAVIVGGVGGVGGVAVVVVVDNGFLLITPAILKG